MTEFALTPTGDLAAAARRYSFRVRPRNPSEPTLRKSRRELGTLATCPPVLHFLLSVILGELARADQRPHKFAQSGLAIPTLGQNLLQLLNLLALRDPRKSGQVEFLENFLIRRPGLEQSSQPAFLGTQSLHVTGAGQHMQSLAKIRMAAALGNSPAIRAAVQLEEARKIHIRILQVDRARARRSLPH